jgi:hypothetical protein
MRIEPKVHISVFFTIQRRIEFGFGIFKEGKLRRARITIIINYFCWAIDLNMMKLLVLVQI